MTLLGERQRVIRPAAIVPARVAIKMLEWLTEHDVSNGGVWLHDTRTIQRFDRPFDGVAGMRGHAVLLGAIHLTWDRYNATIYRANLTDAGLAMGLTVDSLCDQLLRPVGLTLDSCPRAELIDAPAYDRFRLAQLQPRVASD